MQRRLILALFLCVTGAALARGQNDDGFCASAGQGVAGSWVPITQAIADTMPKHATDFMANSLAAYLAEMYANTSNTWVPCSNATITYEGCEQVVAGMNYWLRLNVSCPEYAAEFDDTLRLEMLVYMPLATSNTPPQISIDILSQPEVPDNFDQTRVPDVWVAVPDDEPLFQSMPWEQ